jgi:hypothetical protein
VYVHLLLGCAHLCRVSNPPSCNTDRDPAFFLIADPVLDPSFDDKKLKKNFTAEKKLIIFYQNCNLLVLMSKPP